MGNGDWGLGPIPNLLFKLNLIFNILDNFTDSFSESCIFFICLIFNISLLDKANSLMIMLIKEDIIDEYSI